MLENTVSSKLLAKQLTVYTFIVNCLQLTLEQIQYTIVTKETIQL